MEIDKNKYTQVDLGDRFRDLRKNAKMTQDDLAKKLNVTRSAVNGWEMGQSMPSYHYLMQLAHFYNVSTDYLLGIANDEKIDISDLNNEDKEIIYSLVNRLKGKKDKAIRVETKAACIKRECKKSKD